MDIYLKKATAEQMLLMVKFLEDHKCLAGGRLRRKEQSALSARLWRQCANVLNAVEGEPRPPLKWKRYFISYKSRLLARIKRIKDIQEGKYTSTEPPLTALEERYAAVCGFESPTGKPKLMLEINPLKLSNDEHSSYDLKQESSRHSDSEGDVKPLIYYLSKPSIALNEGVLTTNPDSPDHSSEDSSKDIRPVIYPNEPKITLQEGVLTFNNTQNPFNSRHQGTESKPTITLHDGVLSVSNNSQNPCNLDRKPVMYPNEPKITLHDGILSVNKPQNLLLPRDHDSDTDNRPVLFHTDPKITLHEGEFTINTPRSPTLSSHHRKGHKSDEDNGLEEKDYSISKCNYLKIFGQHVGMKLQVLQENQRIIAEKIINDTLFLAETNSLTMAYALDFANNLKKS